jgi:hypothetical protein
VNPESSQYAFPTIDVPVFAPDGRRVHRFRQSSLKDVDICLRRAQYKMLGALPRTESDSTAMGTSVHTGIELTLLDQIETGVPLSLSTANEAAQQHFSELLLDPTFRWNKTQEGGARQFIGDCLRAWFGQVLPTLVPLEVEVAFGPLTLYEDNDRVIEVVGTMDYLGGDGLKDWKTSMGRPWEPWEVQRWDLQSAVYVWAGRQLGTFGDTFEFVVMHRKRMGHVEVQRIEAIRHEGHFEWLKQRVKVLAELIEREVEVWPLSDNTALCSPKFCDAWSRCKGAFFHQDWPKVDKPRGETAGSVATLAPG